MKVLMIFLFILLASCSSKNSKPQNKKIIQNSTGEPVIASLYDKNCDESRSLSKLGLMDVYIRANGSERTDQMDYSDYQGNPLGGKFVKNVYHSGQYLNRFRYNKTLNTIVPISKTQTRESLPLYICLNDDVYPPESIEASAFSALFALEKSYKFFIDSTNDTALPSIKLNVNERYVEEFIYHETDQEIYIIQADQVDNAFYSFENKSISFVPQKKDNPAFGLSPAWRIPFITAHEMGHHVLNHYISVDDLFSTGIMERYGQYTSKLSNNCQNFSLNEILLEPLDPQKEGVLKILLAYHETFADSFAYLSLGQEYNQLLGVNCLYKSRDIDSGYFVNFTRKQLSTEVLQTYLKPFSLKNIKVSKDCTIPNFTGPHDIGAIVAHATNTLMSLGPVMTNAERLQMMINWAKLVMLKFPLMSSLGPKEYFKVTIKLFLETLNERSALNSNQCAYIKDVFSGLDYQTRVNISPDSCVVE